MKIVENLMINALNENKFTGAAIDVNIKGQSFRGFYGCIDRLKPNNLINKNTLFDIASLTKIITATLFMKLVECQTVQLDDPVHRILPQFKGDEKEKITFRHLLTHSSGLPASFNLYENQEWNKGNNVIINKLVSTPLVYYPGQKILYSCLGYMILGICMEKITTLRLDEILYSFINKPFNITDILFKPSTIYDDQIVITSYSRPNRGILNAGVVHDGNAIALHEGISGNAGIFASLEAISTFTNLYTENIILEPRYLNEMIKLQIEYEEHRRGIGWVLHSNNIRSTSAGRIFSSNSYGHTGFTGTSIWIDPYFNLTVTLLSNSVFFYKSKDDSQAFNEFRYILHKAILDSIIDEDKFPDIFHK